MASLFTDQTPTTPNADDGTPGINPATSIMFAVAGQVTHIRFYSTTTVGGTYTGTLYRVDASDDTPAGTALGSAVLVGTPATGSWVTIPLDPPVTVTPNTVLYRAAVHNTQGRYVATVGFAPFVFGAGGLTNGDIHAPHNGNDPVGLGSVAQGSFRINAAPLYPTQGGNGSCYFVDVVFVPDGEDEPSPAPDSITVPVTLGEPASGYDLAPAPDSLSVPVSLGQPASEDGPVVAPARRSGGWESFGEALRFNADELRREQENPPVDCPTDGEPLQAGPGGVLHCRACGWEWPARRIVGVRR